MAAQDIQFHSKRITVEDGLPHREVNAIFKDKSGFMWMGTAHGIARYDGHEFRVYNSQTDSFINDDIWRILEDPEGWFWLLPETIGENIDIWNPETRELTSFKEKFGPDMPIPKCHPSEWLISAKDSVFVAYIDERHLFVYHPGKTSGIVELRQDLLDIDAHCSLIAADEYIYIVSLNNIISKIRWDGTTVSRIIHNREIEIERAIHNRQLPVIYFEYDKNGNNTSYLLDENGNSRLIEGDYNYPMLIHSGASKNMTHNLIFDHEKFFTLSGKLIEKLKDTVYWSEGSIHRSLYYDHDGFLWTGNDFGVERIRIHSPLFDTYLANEKLMKAIRGIYADSAHVFVNVEHYGPVVYDLKHDRQWEPEIENKGFGYFELMRLENGGFVSAHYFDLLFFDTGFKLKKRVPVNKRVWAALELNLDTLLLGTTTGLYYLDRTSGELQVFDRYNRYGELSRAFITHIERDPNGLIRICSDKGFYTMKPRKGIISRFARNGYTDFNLPEDIIYHYYEEQDGTLWLASGGGGLLKLTIIDSGSANYQLEQFSKATGLSNNVIYAVYPDQQNNLWLTSDLGLMQFNKSMHSVNVFFETDGLPNNEFNRLAHFKDSNGKLYFGGIDGLISFNPDTLLSKIKVENKPLKLVSISVYDRKAGLAKDMSDEYVEEGVLLFKPGMSYVNIELALLNYLEVSKNSYCYRFDNRKEDWQCLNNNELRFEGLPYGTQVLKIKAIDAYGNSSANELEIRILVQRPVFLQTWFLALMLLILVFGISLLYSRRTKALIRDQKRLESLVRERTEKLRKDRATILEQAAKLKSLESLKSRFFANISHELRTPLSLIIGPLDKFTRNGHSLSKDELKLINLAKSNGEKLLKLVNEILDLSRLEKDEIKVEESPVKLMEFLKEIYTSFSSIAKENKTKLKFEFRCDKDLNLSLDREKTEKIINNYMSNALKYAGSDGQVVLGAYDHGGRIRISVMDNGKGIHPEDLPHLFERYYQAKYSIHRVKDGVGIGLSLVKELAELLDGRVWAESDEGAGSIFYFEFEKKQLENQSKSNDLNGVLELQNGSNSDVPVTGENPFEKTSMDIPGQASTVQPRFRVLLVEDNSDLRWYLENILCEDYRVISKSNGEEALDYLEGKVSDDALNGHLMHGPVDLIITDLMMPVMDGFELLNRIKNSDKFRHIPCIVLTARTDKSVKFEALRVGVDDYLVKPFYEEELRVRVRNLIQNLKNRIVLMTETSDRGGYDEHGTLMAKADAEWLEMVENIFTKNLSSNNFKIDWVATKMHLSERQFRRKLKQLTGLSPVSYQREIRLQKARELLYTGKFKSIKELGNAVGISSTKYFSRLFEERFGSVPSQYRETGPGENV